MSFQSSLQPMLTWMRCLGVYLPEVDNKDTSCCMRFSVTLFGLILVFFNLMFNGLEVGSIVARIIGMDDGNAMENQLVDSAVSIMNTTIAQLTHCFVTVVPHLYLMSVAVPRWCNLIQITRKMEKERFFKRQDYAAFRFNFVVGCGVFFAVSSTL